MQTRKWVTTGKGKNQTTEFVPTDTFNAGDGVVIQAVTNNVTVSGYAWDGVMTPSPINIQ
jgi:hypothetical protein